MVSLSSKIFRGMNHRLPSDSRYTGFHVFRRMSRNSTGIYLAGRDLPPKFLNSPDKPGVCGKENKTGGKTRALRTIKAKLHFSSNWFNHSYKSGEDDDDNTFLCTQNSYGYTKPRSPEEPETIRVITKAFTTIPITIFPNVQGKWDFGLGMRARFFDIFHFRSYLKSLSLKTKSGRLSDTVSILVFLSEEERKAKEGNIAFANYNPSNKKSGFMSLMAHKVKDFTRPRHRNGEERPRSRIRFRRFAKETFASNISWLKSRRNYTSSVVSFEVTSSNIGAKKGEDWAIMPQACLEISSFSGSHILDPSFSAIDILNEPYEYWDLGPESPQIQPFGNVQKGIDDFSEFEYLRGSGTETGTIDFSTLTSYEPDLFVKDSAISQYDVPDLNIICQKTKEEEALGLAVKSLLEIPPINFSSADFSDLPEVRDIKATCEFLQPPEVISKNVQCTVPEIKTPSRTDVWEDPGLVLACLEFSHLNVVNDAEVPGKPHQILVGSEKDLDTDSTFDTESWARTHTSKASASVKDGVYNDEIETTISLNIATADLGGDFEIDDSATLDSGELEVPSLGLTEPRFRILDPSVDGDDDAQSWACSPPLQLKDTGSYYEMYGDSDRDVEIEIFNQLKLNLVIENSSKEASGFTEPDLLEAWQYESDFESMVSEDEPDQRERTTSDYLADSGEVSSTDIAEPSIDCSTIISDTEINSPGPISLQENVDQCLARISKRVHFGDTEIESSSVQEKADSHTNLTMLEVKHILNDTPVDLIEVNEEVYEAYDSDEDDVIMIDALVANNPSKDVSNTEYLVEQCRKKLFNTSLIWMRTGLLLLEFETKKIYPEKNTQEFRKIYEVGETSGSGSGSGSSSQESLPENDNSTLPVPETILELENRLMKTGHIMNIEEVQYLSGIIFNYRRVFMHLMKNVVSPCNDMITSLVRDILSVRKLEAELYSLGSGITNEISIISQNLEDKEVKDFPYWQKLNRCHTALADVDNKLEKFHDAFDILRSGFGGRISEIEDRITNIRIIRDRILKKYYLFYEPNKLQGSFGTQDIHQCTHVDEYKQSTTWHYNADFEEFETLLAMDIEALVLSKDSVGGMIISIHEGLAYIKKAIGLSDLRLPSQTEKVIATSGGSPRDNHYFSASGSDSGESESDFLGKKHKRKRRRNRAKKNKRPKTKT